MSILDLPSPPVESRAERVAVAEAHATARPLLTVEHVAYIVLALLSLLVHLWGLGDRALHHDETLHAFYSWQIFSGRGYIHDPLLHGPFLYYLGALVYFVFGDNDFTARLGAALFGTALTVLPFLLRRELGRPAALMAAVYLLISPTVLYVGRFIRHDIYSVVFELLIFTAIVRYATTRHARWLYVGTAAFALMVTNHASSYLFAVIFGAPLLLGLLWRVFRPGVAMLGGLALAVALLIFVLPGEAQVDGAHTAFRDEQTGLMEYTPGPLFGWYPLETEDNAYALAVRNRSDDAAGRGLLANLFVYLGEVGRFVVHPAVLISIGLGLATLGGLGWAVWGRRGGAASRWQQGQASGDPILAAYASLAAGRRWLVALAVFALIYTLFYTAFLTNLLGFVTGTTGQFLYWLAQHNVERGGQPPYYYLVLMTVYEPLLLLWGGAGLLLVLFDVGRRWRRRANQPETPPAAIPAEPAFVPWLLAWWSVAAFFLYSWAGEKMPWLNIHLALPLTLLGSWAVQRVLIRRWPGLPNAPARAALWTDAPRAALALFAAFFVAVASLGFILMTTYVSYGQEVQATLPWFTLTIPLWIVPLFVFLMLGLLVVAAALRWGWPWALGALALCITVGLSFYTVRNSYRLNFLSGDVPREMLIYTQTSPDVMRVVRNLEEASRRRGGGLTMPLIYDNETVWQWYLRDFTNARRISPPLDGPPEAEVQAVLLLQENIDRHPQTREYLEGFRVQRLPLRWWFPEDQTYRLHSGWADGPLENASLLARVLRAPFATETLIRLWDFLIFRDPHAPLGSTDFVIAVRPELADQIGLGLGGSLRPSE